MDLVLFDTNIFIIDRFYQRDERYPDNKRLLDTLSADDAGFYEFSLVEFCGAASFNLSTAELEKWMRHFEDVYNVAMLPAPNLARQTFTWRWIEDFQLSLFNIIRRKVSFGDAFVLQAAEEYNVDAIITWNLKHFVDRTTLPILTPTEYLAQQEANNAK